MNKLVRLILLILILLLTFISLSIGAETIEWSEVLVEGSFSNTLFYKSRIPRTLSLVLTGFAVSLSGLIFQHISRNKFVSPSTSGSVTGAQLGVAISMIFVSGASTLTTMLFAFTASLLTTFLFMGILNRLKLKEVIFIPLLGLMLGGVIKSFTTILAYKFNFLQVLEGWFYGSFSLVISGRYEMLYIVLPAIVFALIYAKAFAITGLGKDFSTNLGINHNKIVNIGLVIIAVINASTVIVVGSIPFLGLVIPNISAIYFGDNLKKNITTVGMMGTLFLLVSDIISRTISRPFEVPVGLVVGVIGCGMFLFLILRSRRIS